MARDIKIEDYTYNLPLDKIAKAPLPNRSDSKLLVYKNGFIEDLRFDGVVSCLPPNCSLVFNNTKVVCARLLFDNPGTSNKPIEIFILEPTSGLTIEQAMLKKNSCTWICLVGNMRHFTVDFLERLFHINNTEFKLTAFKPSPSGDAFQVRFEWDADISFAELLNLAGIIPLPPYLKRVPDDNDKNRYQTVYAKQEGSVAAPTAGLHFTEGILNELKAKGIENEFVVLHVGAGTFKPVKSESMQDHDMHSEEIAVTQNTLQGLLRNADNLIAVGTTSLRTLESLFWIGLKLRMGIKDLRVHQWDAYDLVVPSDFNFKSALLEILGYLKVIQQESINTKTQLLIAPGYTVRSIRGLITNFHQPNSTLLLLVAAFVGNDWRKIYDHALNNDYRFLSYGDGSLLMR